MVVKHLGLIDTYASLFVPYLLNHLLVLYYLEQLRKIPLSLLEAARLEGAGEVCIFFKFIIPLKLRVLSSFLIVLFILHWNNWYPGVLFITHLESSRCRYSSGTFFSPTRDSKI